MTQDARFEDGRETPLNLGALDAEDTQVISALVQDAVFPVSEMTWDRGARRFGLLLNRFRWEDLPAAERRARKPERVQSILVVDQVLGVASNGIDRSDADVILSILSLEINMADDGAGTLTITLAGDGAIRLDIEAIELTLKDVTRPYVAPSGQAPRHPE